MRHTVRPLILIILLFSQPSSNAFGQTKSEIVKHGIYRIDKTYLGKKFKRVYSQYFNQDGNLIKQVETINNPSSKSETIYKYSDTLCIQTEDKIFEGNKQVETVTTKFQYQFDSNKRLIEKRISNSKKNVSIEKYSYNSLNQLDTTFIFDNDTTVFEKGSFLNFKIETKPQPSLKKILAYSYPNENRVLIKDCKYPPTEKNCSFIEDFNSDSLVTHKESFYAVQGCVENHFDTFKKWHKKDGLTFLFETSDFDDKTYYFYSKNQFGFVVEKRENDKPTKDGSKVITVWKYYFRQ